MPTTQDTITPELHQVVAAVTALLSTAELDMDSAVTSSAAMLSSLPHLGVRANLSTRSSQTVVDAVARAARHAAEARGAMSEAHAGLDVLRRALKIPTEAGGTVKTPDADFDWRGFARSQPVAV